MRLFGTSLVWVATVFAILVGANLGELLKRYLVHGREWDIAFLAIFFHVLLLLAAGGLYRMGQRFKALAKAKIIGDASLKA